MEWKAISYPESSGSLEPEDSGYEIEWEEECFISKISPSLILIELGIEGPRPK